MDKEHFFQQKLLVELDFHTWETEFRPLPHTTCKNYHKIDKTTEHKS